MNELKLEFEKPILELQKKIDEMKRFSSENKLDVSEEINALVQKLDTMTRDIYSNLTPWQRIQLARHPDRPYTLDYIERIFTNFMELSGDRRFKDDKAVVGGFAKFNGKPVMIIGTQKGRDMKENLYRNFGWPSPEGYRKALRLMQLADKAGVPVITLIDTPGAFPGIASEERHIGEAIAVNLREMFGLSVPVICVVIGEGGSGGALGISVGNKILLLENAYYSVITPEGCAAILWKNRSFAPRAAEALKLTAADLTKLGVADEVISEPMGGAHVDYDKAAELLKVSLEKNLAELKKLSSAKLREQRYEKFRQIGQVTLEKEAAIASVRSSYEDLTQTQKELVSRHPRGGIMNIDVLSFGRLSHRIFEETGGGRKPVLDDTGKSLILRRIAADYEKSLKVIGSNIKRIGYVHEVKSAISEFMQYGIGKKELGELVEFSRSFKRYFGVSPQEYRNRD